MLRLTAGFPRRVESKSCVYLTSESDCAKIHVRCHLSHRAYGPWVCVYVYWYTCICASSFSCVALDAPESHFHWCISLLSPSSISLSLSLSTPPLPIRSSSSRPVLSLLLTLPLYSPAAAAANKRPCAAHSDYTRTVGRVAFKGRGAQTTVAIIVSGVWNTLARVVTMFSEETRGRRKSQKGPPNMYASRRRRRRLRSCRTTSNIRVWRDSPIQMSRVYNVHIDHFPFFYLFFFIFV